MSPAGSLGHAVVAFDDPIGPGIDRVALLGGKGANLVEMRRALDLPVPGGFIITTEVCRRYLDEGWPRDLDAAIDVQLDRLAALTAQRFGDRDDPLLVSVRSGAPVSMPGMLDTVLNVGVTPAFLDRAADPRFAADTWLRFCRLYAEVVLAIPKPAIDAAVGASDTPAAIRESAERVQALAADAGRPIPDDPREQLRGAIEGVFRSWRADRARAFRAREGISEQLGTAAIVQAMVFGNRDDRSGTGVVFTRDPATGERRLYGDYLARAQGDDVVGGAHAVHGIESLREQLPAVHAELVAAADRLERHYQDMCDVEFTVSEGRLYLLQTRVGRRSPLATVRIAVEMADDPHFPLAPAEAVARVDTAVLQQLASVGRVDPGAVALASGLAVSPGVGVGVLVCDADRAASLTAGDTDVVLARTETSPADVHGMVGASALITSLGGVASHAAVVARSWAIPAVTGIRAIEVVAGGLRIGDRFVPEGALITVDGTNGVVYEGDQRIDAAPQQSVAEAVRRLREWARELGVEPGARLPVAGPGTPDRNISILELARTVQLKGLCNTERAAESLAVPSDRAALLLDEHRPLFEVTPRGMLLSAEGRQWLDLQIEAERAGVDGAALNLVYERFMQLNRDFKELVSGWQLTDPSSQTEHAWLELAGALGAIHDGVAPLIDDVGTHVPRLAAYRRRFGQALAALRSGDRSMLASPLKDSYHTVWFEFHEELIAALGRDRAEEESAEA